MNETLILSQQTKKKSNIAKLFRIYIIFHPEKFIKKY